jgi:hypothetical protein
VTAPDCCALVACAAFVAAYAALMYALALYFRKDANEPE